MNEVSLDVLAESSLEELKDVDGVLKIKAGHLLAAGELGRRVKPVENERI